MIKGMWWKLCLENLPPVKTLKTLIALWRRHPMEKGHARDHIASLLQRVEWTPKLSRLINGADK